MTLQSPSTIEDLRTIHRDKDLLRWAPANPFDHQPDRHLVLTGEDGDAAACCSLWWRETPVHAGNPAGVVGHFFASDGDSARQILDTAAALLKEAGATVAIGPMDGNTWRRYRLMTRRGEDPLFFLEPDNPPEWPGWFSSAGFSSLARYTSSLMEEPPARDERLGRARDRLEAGGIRIRNLDAHDFVGDLKKIHAVSRIGFQGNFLYSPLPEDLFLLQYQQIQPLVLPDLVLIAEKDDQPVGFAFAIPDLLEAQFGRPPRTAILKTLAVLPGRDYAGLGALLAGLVRERAASLGFPRLIHALMHEQNNSRNLAKDAARTIREYTLYSRPL
jgi:GNAT superfamily N-acetyltransferase